MAKIEVYSAIPDYSDWFAKFGHEFESVGHTGNSVAFQTDYDDLMAIGIKGKGLSFDAGGNLKGGTVTSIEISYGGDAYMKLTGLSLDADFVEYAIEVAGALVLIQATDGADTINGSSDHDVLFGGNGNDRLFGKAGNDRMQGDDGKDQLTGGKGSDIFIFAGQHDDRDTIMDFDAMGGAGKQDLIDLHGADYEVHKLGKNHTLITFDDADEIVLRNVRPNQIDDSDFVM